MLSFLEGGLEDLSISRTSFTWGIPVPDDPAHVMYVWFDALTNYMTAAGFGQPDAAAIQRFAKYWPADVHLIGKEIVRQHAVYWPAFLMAADLPLPRQIVSHGWWLMGGAKMSKSKGNVVQPRDYIGRFGLDAFRYFIFREMAFGQDASFTDEAFLTRYNADLANDLGNLVSRATTMIHRYTEGRVPSSAIDAVTADEVRLMAAIDRAVVEAKALAQSFRLDLALREIWEAIAATNRYIVAREPWKLAKDAAKHAELDTSLALVADAVRVIAELLRPFMPAAAERTLAMLGVGLDGQSWSTLKRGDLASGTSLTETAALFPRIEFPIEELQQMSTDQPAGSPAPDAPAPGAPAPTTASSAPAPSSPPPLLDRISIDDFMKVELRVAKVLAAERVPKSKRLLKLQVDAGTETRTLVAGVAEAYEPEALIGRTVAIVFNLQPATLMGVESNGMVLAASPEGGKPMLVSFEVPPAPGTRIR
jgi:methionyl-tRNA synthetase